jgi:hypothetical protein
LDGTVNVALRPGMKVFVGLDTKTEVAKFVKES